MDVRFSHHAGRLLCAACLAGCTAVAASWDGSEAKTLTFQIDAKVPLKLPEVNFGAVKSLPGGDLAFLAPDRWGIHRFSRASGSVSSFSLHAVPESSRASVQVRGDFAVDGAGNVYIPANWFEWKHGSTPKAGVFIFDRGGRYLGTTELAMQCSPERIAVDSTGDFFVLSMDAAYLKGRQKECSLVHKFTRQGQHVVSFSACPTVLQAEGPGPGLRGAAASALREEAERGHLWMQNDQLYHVLPSSRLLRVFDRDGHLVREAAFVAPDSAALLASGGMTQAAGTSRVWRIVGRPDGSFLVEWQHAETSGSRGRLQTTFLALHDSSGRPLTKAAHPPARPGIPVASDSEGRIVFLFLNSAAPERPEVEMALAAVRLQ